MSISLPIELKRNRIYGLMICGSSAILAIFLTYFAYADFNIPLLLLAIFLFVSMWVFYPMTLRIILSHNGIKKGNSVLLWSDIHTIWIQSYPSRHGAPPHVDCTLVGDKQKIPLFLYSETEALLVQEVLTSCLSKEVKNYDTIDSLCSTWKRNEQ